MMIMDIEVNNLKIIYLTPHRSGKLNGHWSPAWKWCNFCANKLNYIIKLEEEPLELWYLLDKLGLWSERRLFHDVKANSSPKAGNHTEGGTPLRKNYAGIDWNYDGVGFFPPQPFNSWTLNDDTYLWEPPVDYPSDYNGMNYTWNETNRRWVETTE